MHITRKEQKHRMTDWKGDRGKCAPLDENLEKIEILSKVQRSAFALEGEIGKLCG